MENVGYSMQNLYYKVLENGCAGAFFGHTHRSAFVQLDDVYLMNPGSLSKPRDGSGGSFGLVVTSEDSLWGKIYSYEDFMLPQTHKPHIPRIPASFLSHPDRRVRSSLQSLR